MLKKLLHLFLVCFLLYSGLQLQAQSENAFDYYRTNEEIQQFLKTLNKRKVKLHNVAESPGGNEITVIEIGADLADVPAIFVGANFEGNVPIATEGALYLTQMLIDSTAYTEKIKWFILPQPNPDAAEGYFAKVLSGLNVNKYQINDDGDEAINEDGFEDLNNDGFITQMRIKDVKGDYVISEHNPIFLRKANTQNGERGVYKVYSEGIDNDKDGLFNEDGEGGINVGIAFPHLFPREKSEAGTYTGQTPEVYGIMRFIYDHPEIAMIYTLGSSNFCLVPPEGGRKGDADLENIKLSGRTASRLGTESGSYKMNEVIDMMKAVAPSGMEITPQTVAGMLGLGAAVNPLKEDLVFYNKFSEQYRDFLANKNFNTETLPPARAKNGSFELWAYYHLGLPSFSMNLFTVPKVTEEKEEDTDSKEEKKLGKAVCEKNKALLAWSEKEWEGKGFVEWENINNQTLGEVEIGGFVPYIETTPKPDKIQYLASTQLPWLLQLSNKLPEFKFEDMKATKLGTGIYKIELVVANTGELPYPISMGERNGQPAPLIVVLNGDMELIEGTRRTRIGKIGSNQVKELSWIIQTKGKQPKISATLESVVFTDVVTQINIGG